MIQQLINISLGSSLIIICSILLKRFINNIYSNKLFYYLWIILAIRLLIPFEINIPIMVINNGNDINNSSIPVPFDKTENVSYPHYTNQYEYFTNDNLEFNKNFDYRTFKIEHKRKVQSKNLEPQIAFIWISGIIFWLAYYFIIQIRFLNKAYKSSVISSDEYIYILTKKIADELKLKKIPSIYISDSIASPMLVNPIKPSIIIPNFLKESPNIDIILKHELIHHKRRDLLFKNIILLASILHWFNPIVHIMVKTFNESCELVCDEFLLKDKNEEYRQLYGKAILDTISTSKKSYYVANICFSTTKHVLKDRIKSIMNMRKRKNGLIIAICLLLLLFISITTITIYRRDIKLSTLSSAILSIESNKKIDFANELKNYLTDAVERNIDIEIQNYVSSENKELENIFLTLPSEKKSEVVVITAYYSSQHANNNAIGISILLDIIRKLNNNFFMPNRDIIFAFCNENEGDKNLNNLLEDRYINVLNINLENISQKNSDSLFLTSLGIVETDYILHLYDGYLKKQGSRINTFNQNYDDTSAFNNSIFLYNYNAEIPNNEAVKKSNLDISSLESLSKTIYETTKVLSSDNSGRIFGSSSIKYKNKVTDFEKWLKYKSSLEFGEYVRFYGNSYGTTTCINNEYQLTSDEMDKISQKYNFPYSTDDLSMYIHYSIEAGTKGEIDKIYSVLSEKPSLEKLESEFIKIKTNLEFNNHKIFYNRFNTHMENIYDPYNRKKTNEQINSYNSLKNYVKNQCINYEEYEEDGYSISSGIEYNQMTNEKYRLTIISKEINEIAHVYQIYSFEDYSSINFKDMKPFIDLVTKIY